MTVSRFAKTILWAVLAGVLTVVSGLFSLRLHNADWMAKTYFETNLYWFILAVAMTGTGVSFIKAAKSDPALKPDVAILLSEGLALLVGWMAMLFLYGGILDAFNASALVAVNINISVLGGMPAVPLVRAGVLSLSTGIDKKHQRTVAVCLVLAVLVGMALFAILGGTWNWLRADVLFSETEGL